LSYDNCHEIQSFGRIGAGHTLPASSLQVGTIGMLKGPMTIYQHAAAKLVTHAAGGGRPVVVKGVIWAVAR